MHRLVAIVAAALVVAPAAAAAPVKVLTIADSGKTVTLAPGQKLHVKLEVCRSCGFDWNTLVAPDKAVLQHLARIEGKPQCEQPCVGGSVVDTLRWRARHAGTTRLRLGYRREGERPVKTFKLTVRVR